MPQMAPLLWLYLFLAFSATFLIFLSMNHFMKSPAKLEAEFNDISSHKINWKW